MPGSMHIFAKDRDLSYNFIDNQVKDYMHLSGGLFHIYRYLGIRNANGSINYVTDSTTPNIQDVVLMENENYAYDMENVIEMYATTKLSTGKIELLIFGASSLNSDIHTITFHYNTMVKALGRKLIPGDIIEFSFMADMDLLDPNRVVSKFYVVNKSYRPDYAWAQNWQYYLWEVECTPLINSPEFAEIFKGKDIIDDYNESGSASTGDNPGSGGGASGTTEANELSIMDTLFEEAEKDVMFVGQDEHNLWLDIDANGLAQLWCENIVTGKDGVPPNMNYDDVQSGEFFPAHPNIGDYFLRTDFNPWRLFIYSEGGIWKCIEVNNRQLWTGVPKPLQEMINNKDVFKNDNGVYENERQSLREVVKAKTELRDPQKEINEINSSNKDTIENIEFPSSKAKYDGTITSEDSTVIKSDEDPV